MTPAPHTTSQTPQQSDEELRKSFDEALRRYHDNQHVIEIDEWEVFLDEIVAIAMARDTTIRIDELNRLYVEHNRRFGEDSCDIIKDRIEALNKGDS